MRIWIDPLKLTRFGLTPADVLQSVRNQNVQLATGELGALPAEPGQQISATIVTRGRLSSPEEFRKILIKTLPDGSSVTVDDVAQVELGAQFYGISARRNSAPSAAVGIKLSPDGNALETAGGHSHQHGRAGAVSFRKTSPGIFPMTPVAS